MNNICQAQDSTFINKPVKETFEFLCDPAVGPTELSPLEETMVKREPMHEVGATARLVIELAARKLNCTSRCVEYEPPYRLVTRMEGDLEGTQRWRLSAENGRTRAQLSIEFATPVWLPAYLQNKESAANWSETLVEQTLDRVKTAVEESA